MLEDAAQAAGADAGGRARGRARRRRHVLVLPLEEPALPGRRRRGGDRRRRRGASWPGGCASTARTTRRRSWRWDTTAASTSCRPRRCASCCPSWTAGTPPAARRRPPTSAQGLGEHVGLPRPVDGRRARLPPLRGARSERADELVAALAAQGIGARGYYRVPVHRQPAMARFAADAPSCRAPTRPPARASPCRWAPALSDEAVREVVDGVRVWVDLTNSPHVLVMRPLIEAMREDGHEVEVTARDFAQTLELCERLGIAHTRRGPPPRRQAREQGARPGQPQRGAGALGARAALRRGDGPRLERRHGRGRACCASRAPRPSTTSGRPSSTT